MIAVGLGGMCSCCLQGTCEWMEGILMKTSSQDISPPKDNEDAALPSTAPKTEPMQSVCLAGVAPEEAQPVEAQPAIITEAVAEPAEELAAEAVTEVSKARKPFLWPLQMPMLGNLAVLLKLREAYPSSSSMKYAMQMCTPTSICCSQTSRPSLFWRCRSMLIAFDRCECR